MKKFLLIIVLLFVLLIGFIAFRFGSALFQEKNPTLVLTSISNLERSNIDYELVSKTNKLNRYVSKNTGDSRYDVVNEFMKEKGWEFKEQMGSGLIFEKNEKTLVVETKQYSQHYILWDIPHKVFN
ncbi:hypothetical protein [Metabacillus fastidiosus]|uniref:hypothetical protein n=1 Tax=Metabacillus fastidiosus TaxID=1458 RepID=UPI003D295159